MSGSTGFTSQNGTGLALSYNEGDGFGASLSKSFSNGVNGGLSWSEKGGVGGNIGYEAPGDKNKPKDSLANQMKGAGGTLSFSQRDGVSAALNASGGVNAGNWSESGGFQANTNFLADKWKADFISGKAKEDADAQEASRGAQNRNNQESGAAAIAGAGVATQRREEDGILDHILGKAAETLGGGLDWVGNKIDGAIDSVVGAASSAWDGAKNAFGGNEVESLCFVAGTLVLTGRGLKTIERIKVGEEVLAYDPRTETQTFKSVVRLFQNETEELVKIKFGNDMEVVTTPGHRFFTSNRGFVLAGELTKEDLLFDKSEQSVRIHTIEKETLKEKTRVFNFEVADYHTYYVSEECILVHNDSVKMLQERLGGEKGGVLSSVNNFLEALDNKMNGSGKFETKEQRNLRESEAHQKLVDNLAGTDKAILEKYGNRIASPEQVAAQYGKNADAYSEQFHFLKDGDGNIVGKIVRDTAYENQTDAQFRDRTRGINSSNICSLASSAGMLMSEGIPQHTPGKKFADELAGGFVERIPSSDAQKPSERITKTFKENVEIYSNGAKTGHSQDPNEQVRNAYTDSGKYGNNAKIKELLDRGIPVMASTKLSSSGHITYIVGYDDSKKTWITHDPYGDKNQSNYGRQGSTSGRAVEYGQNTNGIGDRRIYWMEDKKQLR
ncbi:intein N-terminal splicing domain protein [Leptospira borgpetersenii serovar Pomona str. 200901868]|uniref:Intein N-terminal splicing domain protein n=1 Tax=Leptospira borgpetersenii serovar Pomona str. 200901868 TaxID=1192866 RepID=M6W1I8_LEPBO|nr:intein N-terminal splicing domain protein [Leptospira borgpetersenii serovar Pomona str. 200901868]